MSGLDTSLFQHGPNIYCVPGTVEEENGVGTWLQLSELQAPGPAACKQCCDGGSGSLHTAPVHSSTMGSAEGGKGLYSQAWGPAHSGRPTMPRHIRGSQGTSGHLGDALTPSGSKELPILKEISPEYSIERLTDAETQDPILWPPDEKN